MNKKTKSGLIIHPEELNKKWIDKAKAAGVGVLGLHPRGGEIAPDTLRELLLRLNDESYKALIDYAIDSGLEIEYEIHAAGYLMPKELFSSHPEYFRVNEKGERTQDFNFCVSNSAALSLFASNAAALARALYGSGRKYYFWMDDGRGIKCCCDKCKSVSASDQQLIATNAMIREVRKYRPDAEMAYLAYIDSIELPSIKAESGVFLEYAPFEKYTATGDGAEERIANERRMLTPLLKHFGRADAKVLEYWFDNSLFSKWKKPPKRFVLDEEQMTADIKDYLEIGFESITSFACFLGEDYEELYGDVDITPYGKCF